LKYLNNNKFCVVDITSSGQVPGFHDLIEICIVPVTSGILPDKSVMPFSVFMEPKNLQNAQPYSGYLAEYMKYAMNPWDAAASFERWYEKLKLKGNKRIFPISFNWSAKQHFIMDWLSHSEDGQPFYYDFFDTFRCIDLVTLPLYWNAVLLGNGDRCVFTRQTFTNLCTRFGIEWIKPLTAQTRCFLMLEIYRKFTEAALLGGNPLPLKEITPIDYSEYEDDPQVLDDL